jgi:hypothetical protein
MSLAARAAGTRDFNRQRVPGSLKRPNFNPADQARQTS